MECELRPLAVPMAVADLLRDARERRGLTLEQLAHETKIPVGRLTGFEHEGLPQNGGFYHRAQIRAYAHALSLDERLVLDALDQEVAAATPAPLPQTPPARAARISLSFPVVALGCVIAVAVLGTTRFARQGQTARAVEALAPAATERMEHSVRVVRDNVIQDNTVQGDKTAPTSGAHASLAAVDANEATAAPAATPATPAVAAIPAAPVVTQLTIATQPEGARVTVDGIGWGVTPVTIRHLTEGLKRVRVTADGYAAVERAIDVQPDRVNSVSIQLRSLSQPLQSAP